MLDASPITVNRIEIFICVGFAERLYIIADASNAVRTLRIDPHPPLHLDLTLLRQCLIGRCLSIVLSRGRT
jgi:hypothetical protein